MITFHTTINDTLNSFTQADASEFLDLCGDVLLKSVKNTTRFKDQTGMLRNMTFAAHNQSELIFSSPVHYASFVEFGRPEIRPVSAKCLHFTSGNKEIFCAYAKATSPRPYFNDAIVELENSIESLFDRFFDIKNA
jgi:hypothetical protein